MSLAELIARARQKPEAERRRLAGILTVIASSLVVIVWVVNLKIGLNSFQTNVAATPPPSPFNQMAGVAFGNLAAIKDGFVTVTRGLMSVIGM